MTSSVNPRMRWSLALSAVMVLSFMEGLKGRMA